MIARGFTRAAKSASEVNSPSRLTSAISSIACGPTPFSAASVAFGKPIDARGRKLDELMHQVRTEICAHVTEPQY